MFLYGEYVDYSQDSSKHVVPHLCNSVAFLGFIFPDKRRKGVWSISSGFGEQYNSVHQNYSCSCRYNYHCFHIIAPLLARLCSHTVAGIVAVSRLSEGLSSGSYSVVIKAITLAQQRSNTLTDFRWQQVVFYT